MNGKLPLFLLSFASILSAETALAAWPDFGGNPGVPEGYTGTYESTVVVLSLPKAAVRAMLPDETELMDQDLTAKDHHPLYLLHNRFSKMEAPGIPAFAYDEFATYVPAIRLRNGIECKAGELGVHLGQTAFMPSLYLNLQTPVDVGVNYYGFNKILARVDATSDSFDVYAPGNERRKIYSVRFGKEAALTQDGLAHLTKVFGYFPPSLVGKLKGTGSMIWSGFDIDAAHAEFVSVDGAVLKARPEILGKAFKLREGSINEKLLGAFRVKAVAKGSIPAACAAQAP